MEEVLKFSAEYPLFEEYHWLVYRVLVELHKLGWSDVHPEVVPTAAEDRYCVCGTRPRESAQTLVVPVQLHEMASLGRCWQLHNAIATGAYGGAILALVSDDTIILENIQAGLHFEFCDMKKPSGKRRGGKSGEKERQRTKLRGEQQQRTNIVRQIEHTELDGGEDSEEAKASGLAQELPQR